MTGLGRFLYGVTATPRSLSSHDHGGRRAIETTRRRRARMECVFLPHNRRELSATAGPTFHLEVVDGVATYKGLPVMTEAGPCTTPTVTAGTIS